MVTGMNELMAEIHKASASLVVEKRGSSAMVGIKGKVPDALRARILENRSALTEYLTYDQEAAYELLRAARAYISERYTTGSKLDTESFDERIAQAEIDKDMWALRIAVREWVLAWVRAIAETRKTAA